MPGVNLKRIYCGFLLVCFLFRMIQSEFQFDSEQKSQLDRLKYLPWNDTKPGH